MRTQETIADERFATIQMMIADRMIEKDEEIVFTCDTCSRAAECVYLFDPYNTHGDCLAEK